MKRDAGFTLIEMLVALALTSMIAVAGSTLLIGTVRASDSLGKTTRAVNDLDLSHFLMRDDFANAAMAMSRFGRPGETELPFLSIVRDGWSHPSSEERRSSLLAVEYIYSAGTLTRRTWLRPEPVQSTPHMDRVLATGLARLSARYFDGREWLPEWDGEGADLPKAIELRLEYADKDALTELFIMGGGG
ncbi:MAG: type II secretion system minor pseudopilin GspJ [Hyphomonas sp.]